MASSRSRFSPARLLMGLAATLAVVLAGGFIFVQFVAPRFNAPIESLTFTQSKAVPDFDGGAITITDDERIAQFDAVRDRFSITPGLWFPWRSDSGCAGGTSTDLTITYEGGRTAGLSMYDCANEGDFVAEATKLLSGWRSAEA